MRVGGIGRIVDGVLQRAGFVLKVYGSPPHPPRNCWQIVLKVVLAIQS